MNKPDTNPLFVIKKGSMSREDIRRAEKRAGLCIIECDDPTTVRYLDAPPTANISHQAAAALELMRIVMKSDKPDSLNRPTLTRWFVDILLRETRPDSLKKVP